MLGVLGHRLLAFLAIEGHNWHNCKRCRKHLGVSQ